MKINSKISLVGFLLALSALKVPQAEATVNQALTIEQRLTKITNSLKQREAQIETSDNANHEEMYLSGGWRDGGDRKWLDLGRLGGWGDNNNRGWINTSRGGWGDDNNRNRAWVNGRNWRDGGSWRDSWGDRRRFHDYRDYD